jgi:hypothetical protein
MNARQHMANPESWFLMAYTAYTAVAIFLLMWVGQQPRRQVRRIVRRDHPDGGRP